MCEKICVLCGKLMQQSRVTQWARLYHNWSRYRTGSAAALSWNTPRNRDVALSERCNILKGYRMHSSVKHWIPPTGYETGIQIYHPFKKEKVPLVLKQENILQWYSCGPTVYDSAHIGHASSYIRQDIIRRILSSMFDIDTIMVMAVTDVEDKIIRRSQEVGKSVTELTRHYEDEFFSDMARLNVRPPSIITRVTDHVPCIVDFIKGIQQRGLAYIAKDGSVYFDVNAYGRYGVLGSVPPTSPGTIEEDPGVKKNKEDFALWKSHKPGDPSWESPWGPGRPGWHIECSAMASENFGSCFDLHSGGIDLMFPHHENELAQSCAYHDTDQWVNYWLHTGHLFTSGQSEKMSKSLKNVITVSEVLEKFSPNEFRMLCLLSSYRKSIEFNDERMGRAISTISTIDRLISRCDEYIKGELVCDPIPEAEVYQKLILTQQEVKKAFADDFNTPRALANVMRLVKVMNTHLLDSSEKVIASRNNAPVAAVRNYLTKLTNQLGLKARRTESVSSPGDQAVFNTVVQSLLTSRNNVRTFAKDKKFFMETADEAGIPRDQAKQMMKKLYQPLWKMTDQVRFDLQNQANINIQDTKDGSRWNFIQSNTEKKHKVEKDPPKHL